MSIEYLLACGRGSRDPRQRAQTASVGAGASDEMRSSRGSGPSLALPEHLDCFGHAPLAGLVALGLVDPAGVLLAVGIGQPGEGGAGFGVLCESVGERHRHLDLSWGGVELELDFDSVAGLDA